VESLHRFWDAVQRFADALGSVGWQALGLALAFYLANLVLRTRAWRNILAAAYPKTEVRWPPVFGAYCAGVGVNAIAPARGGDVVKLWLVHSRVPGSTYPTLASSLVAETAFDFVFGTALLVWGWQTGALPSLPSLPHLPVFEFSWLARNPLATIVAVLAAAVAVAVTLSIVGHRVRAFSDRLRQGLAILARPRRYLTGVVSYQFAGWCCRVAAAFFFLRAFHVDATLRNALLVLVVQGVATSLPLTPGGVGPKQALAVVVLAGAGSRSDILAFSVGMELAILIATLVLGAICLAVLLRGFRFRRALAAARAERARAEGTSA
jgi:uncharacterized membrane protein YbhN (UPF0104 family)